MKVAIYFRPDDARHVAMAGALVAGFKRHGEDVEESSVTDYVQPKGGTQVAVWLGYGAIERRIYEDHRRAARHTLFVGERLFGAGEQVSVVLDGMAPRYAHKQRRPHDRLERLDIDFKPKRARGRNVLFVGAAQAYCDWHGLGGAIDYATGFCHALNKQTHSEFPVFHRPHPEHMVDAKGIMHTTVIASDDALLAQLGHGCHLLATHGSTAAFDALIAGVPVLLLSKEDDCAAWPLAETRMENFHAPHFPDDKTRTQVFADLAYCQFTLDEIASGFAWETLIPHTAKGLGPSLSESERAIAMYRMMHASPKMFRGASMKGHAEAVADIVARYGCGSLLDYGSGKGEQYEKLRLHERWGGIRPVCYDPGYEPLAKKPVGRFDGVICCDVAEHIPESGLGDFLRDVVGYADKVAFFCIFTEPSRKFLPNGDNCHLTVREPEWWILRIAKVTGRTPSHWYDVQKPLPAGGFEVHRHTVLRAPGAADVVVTFRGGD